MSAGLATEKVERAFGVEPVAPSPSHDLQPDGAEGTEAATLPVAPARAAAQKIGIDANRPVDPKTGRLAPQAADPDLIASTGAGWVRLNFVLKPWTSPHDKTPCGGRTWAQAYQQIVSGYRDKGLSVYGLIGVESAPGGPGDRFREPPPQGNIEDDWIDQYVKNFCAIVQIFCEDVQVFESFNEPDDWHGQDRNWVHPGWFAIMLQRIHEAIRSKPELGQVILVSGPLQGLESNRNAAVHYLQQTYHAGKSRYGWGRKGVAIPFDGVGYHLYVKGAFNPDAKQQKRAIRATCRRYLEAMHQVIRQEEGQDRPLYVSEVGWNSRIDPRLLLRHEEFQAECLRAGLKTVCSDPLVELGIWFCTQDFGTESGEHHFGLYRAGQLSPDARKPAFDAFKAVSQAAAERKAEAERRACTNQQLIAAFYRAGQGLGMPRPWDLFAQAGLSLRALAANRHAFYEGRPIEGLPGLTDVEKAAIQASLDEQQGILPAVEAAAGAGQSGLADLAAPTANSTGSTLGADFALDLSIALQDQVLEELERNNQLLTRLLDKLERLDYSDGVRTMGDADSGMNDILHRVRGLLS